MILGFTGSREQPTPKQLQQLNFYMFDNDVEQVHHGACVGSDLAMHRCAINYAVPIVVHPPIKEAYLAVECLDTTEWDGHDRKHVTVLPRKEYHARNWDIVRASNRLLVMPNGPWRPHSGTWSTHDYAVEFGVPRDIIWPDGRLEIRP